MTGGAVTFAARELHARILDHAADLLEANVDDLADHRRRRPRRGRPRDLGVVRRRREPAAETRPAGGARSDYDGGEGGWAMATHVCWVDVDLETGFVKIPRYVVVEDCGELINPAIVEGQIRGGVAQGVGAVLYERTAYDDDANLQRAPSWTT